MLRLYYNLAKKSTLVAILGFFLFSNVVFAKIPNDPEYLKQQKMWQQIGAERAWDYSTGSNQVTVAIIDTGADIWHDDLVTNVWKNPYEIPDNGYDDDGNGFIDDVHGWNFIENNNDIRTSVFNNTEDPEAIRHGTVIAGLIGAAGNNNKSGTGLNWKIKIMPLRAIDSNGNGSYSQVNKAIRYAIDNKVDVISMSMVGTTDDAYLKQILREAYDKGIVIVTAAGNDQRSGNGDLNAKRHYPVCMDADSTENWIIGVSAVDENDKLSDFANYGSCVDLVAPGQNIFSTERFAPAYGYNKEFSGPWQGTSFSVPLVAGSAALLKSIRPDWSAKDIIDSLLKNSDDIQSKNSVFSNQIGFGRLNVGKTVESAIDGVQIVYLLSKESYYFKNTTIYTKGEKQNYFFGSSGDAPIVALTATRSLDGKSDEVFAMVKRSQYYYVQFFTEQGRQWTEVAVPTGDYSSKKIPTSIKINSVDDQRTFQIEYNEKIVKKGKKTTTKITAKQYKWLDLN
ncbi:MAG: S8 family peptidase [Candidatus Magasanikbacteria bacterium]